MTPDALATLASYAEPFADPAFRVGDWEGGMPDERGVVQMPFVLYTETVDRFVEDIYRVGLVNDFDWMRWSQTPRGQALLAGPDAVAGASADELARLLTTVIRSERFGEGMIEAAFERGVIQAAARRAGELARGRG